MLASRTAADQRTHDFLELKYSLDYFQEDRTPSACVSKLLDNFCSPDHAEYAISLAQTGAKVDDCARSMRRVQRKIELEK